jgi:hypothetical protein
MDFDFLLNIDKQTIFIYFPIFLGVILFLLDFRLLYKSLQSENWSQTDGIITKSELYKYGGGDSSVTYEPLVEYQYEVNGKIYKSKRLYFGSSIGSSFKKRRSQKYVNKFPTDTKITVYYNELNIKQSVIETGIHSEILGLFVTGILMCIGGYLAMIHPEFFK